MSMNFQDPVNDATLKKIAEEFGDKVVTHDRKTFLLNDVGAIHQRLMKQIANEAKQPVAVEMHDQGDIKVMSDGTRYRVTPQGWQKIDE